MRITTIIRWSAVIEKNWSLEKSLRQEVEPRAGTIMIAKRCLLEPEVHVKKRRVSKGRKALVEKRILRTPDIGACLSAGDIVIEPCGLDAYEIGEGMRPMPMAAFRLIWHIFERYQADGALPEIGCFIQ